MKVPQRIEKRISDFISLSQRANAAREEIDDWLLKQGINVRDDSDDLVGIMLNDILIDGGLSGDIEATIELFKQNLSDNSIDS